MGLETISQQSLAEIRAQKAAEEAKNVQLQKLGVALTEEKIKGTQKDAMIQALGKEIANLKIEITQLKGAIEK